MKRYVSFAALFSVLAMATPLSISAFAHEAATSPARALHPKRSYARGSRGYSGTF